MLGGPTNYSGGRIQAVHAHLGISHAHFDEVKTILADVLETHGFSEPDAGIVLAAIEAHRRLIVAAPTALAIHRHGELTV